jgi:hypothetical protein
MAHKKLKLSKSLKFEKKMWFCRLSLPAPKWYGNRFLIFLSALSDTKSRRLLIYERSKLIKADKSKIRFKSVLMGTTKFTYIKKDDYVAKRTEDSAFTVFTRE